MTIAGSHNQATPSEDYNKPRRPLCVIEVRSVVTSYMRPINPIINPNPT
jgi:hypothetical protein